MKKEGSAADDDEDCSDAVGNGATTATTAEDAVAGQESEDASLSAAAANSIATASAGRKEFNSSRGSASKGSTATSTGSLKFCIPSLLLGSSILVIFRRHLLPQREMAPT